MYTININSYIAFPANNNDKTYYLFIFNTYENWGVEIIIYKRYNSDENCVI